MNKVLSYYSLLFCIFSVLMMSITTAEPSPDDYEHYWYAKQFKVSLQEAKRRSHLSSIASKIAAEFNREKTLFSGMITKNDPPYRIIFEVKRFGHCAKIIYTPRFKKDKRCNIVTRIKDKLRAANIVNQVDIVFVKHSRLDQENLQRKATYYANRYAKNVWASIGWDHLTHRIEIGVLYKTKFENALLAANVFLPSDMYIKEVKSLPTFR